MESYRKKRDRFRAVGIWLLATLLLLFSSGVVAYELPDIGEASDAVLSPAEDRRLGEAFMRRLRHQVRVIDDPEMNEYINRIGTRLAIYSDDAATGFHFFLVESPVINAFAGPGGYIGIHTGLLVTAQSESELAAVLAHEIAHVTQNHLKRTFQNVQKMSLPLAAALVAAILLGGSGGGDLAPAAIAGIQAGAAQHQINFTRANEKEADRIGIGILARAEFDPRSMPVFFERMQQANRFYGSKVPEILRSHPVTENRIADARGRSERFPYRQFVDSLGFHLVRAKLKVEAKQDQPQEAVRHFAGILTEGRYRFEPAARYAYALALMKANATAQAREQIALLLKEDPDRIAYLLAQAEIEVHSQKENEALRVLRQALHLYPQNHPLSMFLARVLLSIDQPQQALEVLQAQSRIRPEDPRLYKMLAEAAGRAGLTAQGHEYQAEYYYRNGATKAAIQQLEIALKRVAKDYYRSARIAARLKIWRKEREEEEQEKKAG